MVGNRDNRGEAEIVLDLTDLDIKSLAGRERRGPPHAIQVAFERIVPITAVGAPDKRFGHAQPWQIPAQWKGALSRCNVWLCSDTPAS